MNDTTITIEVKRWNDVVSTVTLTCGVREDSIAGMLSEILAVVDGECVANTIKLNKQVGVYESN